LVHWRITGFLSAALCPIQPLNRVALAELIKVMRYLALTAAVQRGKSRIGSLVIWELRTGARAKRTRYG
jgi:hypothetical protein